MDELAATMRVLTTAEDDRRVIGERWAGQDALVAVFFCAAWCDTCTEFRAALEHIAATHPDVVFVWLDIEDDSDICGDIDVENFPTLAIFRGGSLLHFGVSLPQEGTVARLVERFAEHATPLAVPPAAVARVAAQLREFRPRP